MIAINLCPRCFDTPQDSRKVSHSLDLTNADTKEFTFVRNLTNHRVSEILDNVSNHARVFSTGIAQGAHLGRIPESTGRRKDRSELSEGGDN